MNRLLKLQVRNLFHSKLFYICLILSLFMSTILSFLSSLITHGNIKPMPEIVSFLSSEIGIVTTIFVVLFTCAEFNEDTVKNIIGRGYTRAQFLFSKYLISLLGLFVIYAITIVLDLVLFARNGMGYESTMPLLIINSIFSILAHSVLFVTLSFILEKNGSSIIACLFVPTVLSLLLGLLESSLKIKLSKYWLDNVAGRFLKLKTWPTLGWSILFYLIYIAIFIIIGLHLIKKKEIK